jgi:plasmid stabilization system protein ParE
MGHSIMKSMVVRARAKVDIDEIFEWYELQQSGLGHRFRVQLIETLEVIERHPMACAATRYGVRRKLVIRFPYLICYRILADVIDVVAVVHASRHSSVWVSRVSP